LQSPFEQAVYATAIIRHPARSALTWVMLRVPVRQSRCWLGFRPRLALDPHFDAALTLARTAATGKYDATRSSIKFSVSIAPPWVRDRSSLDVATTLGWAHLPDMGAMRTSYSVLVVALLSSPVVSLADASLPTGGASAEPRDFTGRVGVAFVLS
jgi:hypothetical protein